MYVGPQNTEGLHPLRSLFYAIDLYDEIQIKLSDTSSHHIDFLGMNVDAVNTCTRVFDLMKDHLDRFWSVTVIKHIPIGAGLGGGSSNAGTLIRALNTLESLDLAHDDLLGIAKHIGSDVPFFLTGGACDVSGIGDVVRPLQNQPPFYFVLVFPNQTCHTADIYAHFDSLGDSDDLSTLGEDAIFSYGYNSLAHAVFDRFPDLNDLMQRIESIVSVPVFLSGSGSTLYLMMEDPVVQTTVFDKLNVALDCRVHKCSSVVGTEGRT